jgi:hypothetical protein
MVFQVVALVAPLADDAECVFQEGDDEEEAGNDGEVRLEGGRDAVNDVLKLGGGFLDAVHGLLCAWLVRAEVVL